MERFVAVGAFGTAMVGNPETTEITPTEALLRQAQALEEAAAIWAEIAKRGGAEVSAPATKPAAKTVVAPDTSGWANLPLVDAIYECLRTMPKGPKKPEAIWKVLARAGVETTSDNPTSSVKWAIKKLAAKNDDVVALGWGQWDLKSNYTKAGLERALAARAGRGGRSAKEHAAKTSAGMRKRAERGEPIGAPLKMVPPNWFRRTTCSARTLPLGTWQSGSKSQSR